MANMRDLTLVVAAATNGVIGRQQTLPWRLRTDLQRFKQTTMGHGLLMGRKTYESIGRALPGRTTIVLSRNPAYNPVGVLVADSIDSAVSKLGDTLIPFVVGGAEIYRMALPLSRRVLLTRVMAHIEGDAYFESLSEAEWEMTKSISVPSGPHDDYPTQYQEWTRVVG